MCGMSAALPHPYFIQQILQRLKCLAFFSDKNAAAVTDDVENNLIMLLAVFQYAQPGLCA